MPPNRYCNNVPGDFYVEDGCCINCGVPMTEASDLIRFDEDGLEYPHCYVYRQPTSPDELDQMLGALSVQDMGCIRYGGTNKEIVEFLAAHGMSDDCDYPLPEEPELEGKNFLADGSNRKAELVSLVDRLRRWWTREN